MCAAPAATRRLALSAALGVQAPADLRAFVGSAGRRRLWWWRRPAPKPAALLVSTAHLVVRRGSRKTLVAAPTRVPSRSSRARRGGGSAAGTRCGSDLARGGARRHGGGPLRGDAPGSGWAIKNLSGLLVRDEADVSSTHDVVCSMRSTARNSRTSSSDARARVGDGAGPFMEAAVAAEARRRGASCARDRVRRATGHRGAASRVHGRRGRPQQGARAARAAGRRWACRRRA